MRYNPVKPSIQLFLCFISFQLMAAPLELDHRIGQYSVEEHLLLLEDPGRQLTINDIRLNNNLRFSKSEHKVPNFGQSRSIHWAKISVNSADSEYVEWLLVIEYALLDYITFYVQSEDNSLISFKTGDAYPFLQRPFEHRNFVLPLKLSPGASKTVYIKIDSQSSIQLPIKIYTSEKFFKDDHLLSMANGIFFGVAIIMCLYNLLIFFKIRDSSFLHYVLFTAYLIFINANCQGFSAQYLWPNNPWWINISSVICPSIGIFIGCMLARSYINTKSNYPLVDKIFHALQCLVIMNIFLLLLLPAEVVRFTAIKIIGVLMPLYIALTLLIGTLSWINGNKDAKYYTLASAGFMISVLMFQISYNNYIPGVWVSLFSQQIGSMILIILLPIGLANRMKKMRTEMNQAKILTKVKNDFLAVMSHEIRTPMNGILGMAQLLDNSSPTLQQKSYIKTILSSGQLLMTVLNDILDFSKMETGQISINNTEYDVRQLIDQTCAAFSCDTSSKGIEFNVYIDANVPLFNTGDPNRVRQVLTNLISNAIKFTSEGEVKINVFKNDKHNEITISVQDTGIGISKEKQEKLFESFSHSSHSTTRKFGGAGLGLAIAKQLSKLMGGKIIFNSREGEGATFDFSIPIKPTDIRDYVSSQEYRRKVATQRFMFVSGNVQLIEQMKVYSQQWGAKYQLHTSLRDIHPSILDCMEQYQFFIIDQIHNSPTTNEIFEVIENNKSFQDALIIVMTETPEEFKARSSGSHELLVFDKPFKTSIILECITQKIIEHPLVEENTIDPDIFSGKSVLVVDDNEVNLKVAEAFLKDLNIDVELSCSGIDTIEKICSQGKTFDLILMDCEMPIKDGFQTTKEIRDWESKSGAIQNRIVAFSAHVIGNQPEKCLKCGMDDFLSKPITLNKMKETLQSHLLNRQIPRKKYDY